MITFRSATPADVALLRYWDEQPHVIASDPNDDWQWETEIGRVCEWRRQLIAEADGRPVGYLEIIDPAREECPSAAPPRGEASGSARPWKQREPTSRAGESGARAEPD